MCDIARGRTQCPAQIVPLVSCVISQDAEPNARNKSYPLYRLISQDTQPNARNKSFPLSRVSYHKKQNPMPVTNRTKFSLAETSKRFGTKRLVSWAPITDMLSYHTACGSLLFLRRRQCAHVRANGPRKKDKSYPLSRE